MTKKCIELITKPPILKVRSAASQLHLYQHGTAEFVPLGDNSTALSIQRLMQRSPDTKFVFSGNYHNMLTLYSSVKKKLVAAGHEKGTANAKLDSMKFLLDVSQLKQDTKVPLIQSCSVTKCPTDLYTLRRLVERTVELLAPKDENDALQVLVPIHTFLNGIKTAEQWYQKGLRIEALKGAIVRPEYATYLPTRQDYINLLHDVLKKEVQGKVENVVDVGTGTGVLALLAQKMLSPSLSTIGTDINLWAIECAQHNAERICRKEMGQIRFEFCDMFPETMSRADVIICNPPWLIPSSQQQPQQQSWNFAEAVMDSSTEFVPSLLRRAKQQLKDEHSRLFILYSDLEGSISRTRFEELCEANGLVIKKIHAVPAQTSRTERYNVLCYVVAPR